MNLVYNPSLKIQELKKLKEANMIQFTTLYDCDNKPFTMLALTNDAEISPYLPGYIITKEGVFLPVVNGDTHKMVADQYVEKYFHKRRATYEFYLDALFKTGATMYIGGRMLEDGEIDETQKEGYLLLKQAPYLYPEAMLDGFQRLEKNICENHMYLNYIGTGTTTYESPFGTDFTNNKKK